MHKNAAVALVDDSDLIRLTMRAILEDAGFIVHSFSCPTQLLDSASLQLVDCLVTDLDMPVMDGCELQLHVKCRRPNLPVIFVTGSTDEQPRRNALRRGAFAYLSKPTGIRTLLHVLGEAIASCATQRIAATPVVAA